MYLRVIQEALSEEERDKLPDEDFGIPETRSYPMPDPEHVKYAIQMFDRSRKEDRDELAKNIIKFIKKYDMKNDIHVGKNNNFYKYWKNNRK